MYAIEVENLSKNFGDFKVLDSISFKIPQGEIFGFLGPNGSGKTTAVRVINGILGKSLGSVKVHGIDLEQNVEDIHRISGVMTETASSYENLTAWENLDFFGKMHEMNKLDIAKRSEEILKTLDLYEHRDKKVKTYSTGMKKRMSLARALLHNPKVLFLDEPTSGLDPESARSVSLMIKKLAKEHGVTVFLCTHQLKYAEEICSLYGFLNRGRLIGFGTFEELLKEKNSGIYLEIRGTALPAVYENYLDRERGIYRVPISGDMEASSIIKSIVDLNGQIYEVEQSHWNLEDLYFAYQGGESK